MRRVAACTQVALGKREENIDDEDGFSGSGRGGRSQPDRRRWGAHAILPKNVSENVLLLYGRSGTTVLEPPGNIFSVPIFVLC